VASERRADVGFAEPEIYASGEREQIVDTIGLAPNARLAAFGAPLVADALAQQAAIAGAKVRLFAVAD
jgi:hypothetical protein